MSKPFIHESSYVDDDVIIGEATMTIQLTLTERHSGIKGLLAFPTTL